MTVHLSCTLHMSQPPVERERRVMYTSFRLPEPVAPMPTRRGSRPRARGRERAHRTVSQTPARRAAGVGRPELKVMKPTGSSGATCRERRYARRLIANVLDNTESCIVGAVRKRVGP